MSFRMTLVEAKFKVALRSIQNCRKKLDIESNPSIPLVAPTESAHLEMRHESLNLDISYELYFLQICVVNNYDASLWSWQLAVRADIRTKSILVLHLCCDLVHFFCLSFFCLALCIRRAAICFLVTAFGCTSITRDGWEPIAGPLAPMRPQYNKVPTSMQHVAKPSPQKVKASEKWICLLPVDTTWYSHVSVRYHEILIYLWWLAFQVMSWKGT